MPSFGAGMGRHPPPPTEAYLPTAMAVRAAEIVFPIQHGGAPVPPSSCSTCERHQRRSRASAFALELAAAAGLHFVRRRALALAVGPDLRARLAHLRHPHADDPSRPRVEGAAWRR